MDRVTLIADSREREPYAFDPVRVDLVRRALPAGDYSVEGMETQVAVERKSIDDFVSTVIRSRARFHRELARLRDYEAACVVVEADMADVFAGRFRSAAHPASVFGAMQSIIVDFRIPVFFCSDRQIACRFTQDYLLRFHQRAREADDVQP